MFARLRQIFFGRPTGPAAEPAPPVATDPSPPVPVPPQALTHLLAMETVVDRNGKTAGKFIRLRQSARQHFPEHTQHADTVLLEALSRIMDVLSGPPGRVLLVELGCASLPHPLMDALATRKAVLLLAHGEVSPDALTRLAALKLQGLRLVLWLPGEWQQEVADLADGYVFSFDGRSPVEAAELVERVQHHTPTAALMAVDIAWREEYVWCQHIGCHYAAGKLFRAPSWPDSPIDQGFVRILDTLSKVRQEAAPEDIARTLKGDPLLTFRLLAQANSSAQGLGRKVDTIEQAVVVVGRSRLYRWLVLLLYASGKHSNDGPVLQEMAQVRAELMIRLGERYLPGNSEELYLTGLFSLLEPLMQRPLAHILTEVSVSEPIRAALLERCGPYAPFLALAEAAEQNTLPSSELFVACGISASDFNCCLLEALIQTETGGSSVRPRQE